MICIMKTKAICSFFVLFAIVAGIGSTTPAAFADHTEVTIVPDPGSGSNTDDCVDIEHGCYVQGIATVDVGGVVIFSNDDTAAHTMTSGTPGGGDAMEAFDSGMVITGNSWEFSPDTVGEFPYFCMIHPWMEGVLIVQEAGAEEHDVELMVTITDSVVDDGTQVDLGFSELHVNYEITVTQNGEIILQETAHSMEMTASHMVNAVGSDENPIDIEIVSLGIGAPGAEDDWTGPLGTVATTQVVPEFGTIAMMVLAVAIISIVAVTAKSRVIPRF